jgi:hypothetical protein
MKQKSGPDKAPAEQVLKDIRRQTRRQCCAAGPQQGRGSVLLGMVQADWAFAFDFSDDHGHRLSILAAHQIGGPVIRE